jgi:hypothetical protein
MAFRHGRFAEITVNSVALSTFCDEAELSLENDTAETTTFTKSWKTHIPGLNGGSLSLSGSYDPTASTGPAAVLEALIGAAAFPVVAEMGGNASGQRRHSFNALLTSYSESSPVGDKVIFSAELLADGAVTPTTI